MDFELLPLRIGSGLPEIFSQRWCCCVSGLLLSLLSHYGEFLSSCLLVLAFFNFQLLRAEEAGFQSDEGPVDRIIKDCAFQLTRYSRI